MKKLDHATRQRLTRACDDLRSRYESDPNVTGFAYGFREQDGELTSEPSAVVYVARKRHSGLVASDRRLPRTVSIDGQQVAVDVVQAGPFYALGAVDVSPPPTWTSTSTRVAGRFRPARVGVSIGHVDITAGTLGCLVLDNSDDSLQILSNNHVLAHSSLVGAPAASVDDKILQPGPADGGDPDYDVIARLTRWVPFDPSGSNTVDCAIASPIDDDDVSSAVVDDQMDPIGSSNPAVGLLFAGDCTGRIFGCSMSNILAELNVRLPGGSDASVEPDVAMPVHKVGRTTEYTSSSVVRIGAIGIDVDLGGIVVRFDDLFEVASFGHPGDSGSVIAAGGQNDTPTDDRCTGCLLAGPAGEVYDLPLEDDIPLADRIRDEFLGVTVTGRLLTRLFYINQEFVATVIDGIYPDPTAQSYAQSFYDRWRDWIESCLDQPDDPTAVVTSDLYNDFLFALNMHLSQYMTGEEFEAARSCAAIIEELLGSTFQEVLDFMDLPSTFDRVEAIFKGVPTIQDADPFEPPAEPGLRP